MKEDYENNIEFIRSIGFEDINFGGYGGTGYRNNNMEIWWGEWCEASVELVNEKTLIKKIHVGNIATEDIRDKVKQAVEELKTL